MANITLDGLPAKTGAIDGAGILHLRESGVDKKMTVANFLIRISEEYSTDINTFLGAADKAAGRAALGIARRTAVSNANYTILVTDKVVAQTGTMSAARIFSLPAASTYPAGEELIVEDESGTVTATNKITVQRNGTDTIDGLTSIEINKSYGILKLISDGVDSWKIANITRNYQQEVALMVWLASNQTVTTGVSTKITLNTELIDIGGYFDSSTNYRWTPPAGRYLINYGVKGIDAGVTAQAIIGKLYFNGSAYHESILPYYDNGNATVSNSLIIDLNGTDYVELFGQTGGTGAVNIGGGRETYLSGYRLSK